MNTAALGRALRRTPPHLILLLGRARARTSTRSSRAWTRRSRRCARHIPRPSCSPGRCTSSPPSPTGRATIAGSLASSQDAGLSPRCAARRRPGRRWRPVPPVSRDGGAVDAAARTHLPARARCPRHGCLPCHRTFGDGPSCWRRGDHRRRGGRSRRRSHRDGDRPGSWGRSSAQDVLEPHEGIVLVLTRPLRWD